MKSPQPLIRKTIAHEYQMKEKIGIFLIYHDHRAYALGMMVHDAETTVIFSAADRGGDGYCVCSRQPAWLVMQPAGHTGDAGLGRKKITSECQILSERKIYFKPIRLFLRDLELRFTREEQRNGEEAEE